MQSILATAQQFLNDAEGATAVEYGMISSLITLVCLAALTSTGVALGELFSYLATGLSA